MRVTAKEVGLGRLATRNRGRLRRAAGPALVGGKLVRNHAISGENFAFLACWLRPIECIGFS